MSVLFVCSAGFVLAQEADIVLRNGVIWTVDDEKPRADAVASTDGHLIYVGNNSGVDEHINEVVIKVAGLVLVWSCGNRAHGALLQMRW